MHGGFDEGVGPELGDVEPLPDEDDEELEDEELEDEELLMTF